MKYDKVKVQEIHNELSKFTETYKQVQLIPNVLKHLPKTYKNLYLIAYEYKNDKNEPIHILMYANIEYGEFTKGPAMYSSETPCNWEALAKCIKESFHIY